MKICVCVLALIISFFCKSKFNNNENDTKVSVLIKILEDVFKDDFFKQYFEKECLIVITNNQSIYSEIYSSNFQFSFELDTVLNDQTKYLKVNNYLYIGDIFRVQIECYDTKRNYNIMYSTSYKISKKGEISLIKDCSPFIDTVFTQNTGNEKDEKLFFLKNNDKRQ